MKLNKMIVDNLLNKNKMLINELNL